jgi:type II secretion system protein I
MADRRRTGFTLLEALLALAILSAAGAGILTMRARAVRNAHRAANARSAVVAAGSLLSQVALEPPTEKTELREVVGRPGFSYRVSLSDAAVPRIGKARNVRIEVRYPLLDAKEHESLVVETLVPYEGLEP